MTKNTRFFLASLFLSLPLWWGANISAGELTEIFLWRELTTNPEILAAQVVQIELEKRSLKKLNQQKIHIKVLFNPNIIPKINISSKCANLNGLKSLRISIKYFLFVRYAKGIPTRKIKTE